MNKYNNYKQALAEYKEVYVDKTFKGDHCPSGEWYLEIIGEACEKAEKYDEVWDRLTKNHLTTDEEVEECNEYYIKQDAAKEIIEMIDAMCADENDFVIWKSGKYLPTKNIIQKIKERYGIKEAEK